MQSSPSPTCVGKEAIHTLQPTHHEQTHARVAHLEAVIADPSIGQVVKSKARVELALLKEHDRNDSVQRDLAEVKEAGQASMLKGRLEYAILKGKEDKVRISWRVT